MLINILVESVAQHIHNLIVYLQLTHLEIFKTEVNSRRNHQNTSERYKCTTAVTLQKHEKITCLLRFQPQTL